MENVIASLRARRKTIQTELDAIDNAIKALQNGTSHEATSKYSLLCLY